MERHHHLIVADASVAHHNADKLCEFKISLWPPDWSRLKQGICRGFAFRLPPRSPCPFPPCFIDRDSAVFRLHGLCTLLPGRSCMRVSVSRYYRRRDGDSGVSRQNLRSFIAHREFLTPPVIHGTRRTCAYVGHFFERKFLSNFFKKFPLSTASEDYPQFIFRRLCHISDSIMRQEATVYNEANGR